MAAKHVVLSGYRTEITPYSNVYWVLEADHLPGRRFRPYIVHFNDTFESFSFTICEYYWPGKWLPVGHNVSHKLHFLALYSVLEEVVMQWWEAMIQVGMEIMFLLRSELCKKKNFARTSRQLPSNFDTTSLELRHNFARTSTQLHSNFVATSTQVRSNFVATSI